MSKTPPSFGHWLRTLDSESAATEKVELASLQAPLTRGNNGHSCEDAINLSNYSGFARNSEPPSWDWLFHALGEAVLIIDAVSENIVEGNPAAATLLGTLPAALVGSRFQEAFDSASGPALRASLARARTAGRASARVACMFRGAELDLTISLFETPPRAYFVVNAALPGAGEAEQEPGVTPSAAFTALDDAAIGFLVTDSNFRVEYANRGFLALMKLNSQLSITGTPLVRWLGFSTAQLASLGKQCWSRRAIGDLITTIRIEQDAPRPVEVSVVAVPDGPTTLWGFCVREIARLH